MTIASAPKTTLYDQDLNLWVEDTIAKLKAKDFDHVDIENLIEEIESLGTSERSEIQSRLATLLEHLLKRCYVSMPDCFRGWQVTIAHQRQKLKKLLKQSPSLKRYFLDSFEEEFVDALEIVRIEYDVQFPDTWQFGRDIDSLLNVDFWE